MTLFAPKDFEHSSADCHVAAENIMLAAHSLGIGSCMVARAEETFASELGARLQEEWGIGKELEAKVHITLGYTDGEHPPAKPRKKNRVVKIGGQRDSWMGKQILIASDALLLAALS